MSYGSDGYIATLLEPEELPINWGLEFVDQEESLSLSAELLQLPGPDRQRNTFPLSSALAGQSAASADTTKQAIQPLEDSQALLDIPQGSQGDPIGSTKAPTANSRTQPSSSREHPSQQPSLTQQPSPVKQSRYDDALKLQRNRDAQKRFSERHKVHSPL